MDAVAEAPATAMLPIIKSARPISVATISKPRTAVPAFTARIPALALSEKLPNSINSSRFHFLPALYSL